MLAVQNTVASMRATPTVVTSLPPKEVPQDVQMTSNHSTQGRSCSRYQFECRSSGECIAIYNACDGIPQCADGSDEGAELNCPTQGTTQLPTVITPAAAPQAVPVPYQPHNPPVQLQQHVSAPSQGIQQQGGATAVAGGQTQQQGYRPAQQPLAWGPQSVQQYPGSQKVMEEKMFPQQTRGKLYGREGEGPGQGYGAPTGLQWSNYQQTLQQPGTYHQPMAQFPPAASHEYEDQNSHIFNHKGNGLVADSDSPAPQYSEVPHNEYNKFSGTGPNNYYNNIPYRQPVQNNWLQQSPQPAHDSGSVQGLEDLHMRKLPPEDPYSLPPIPPDYYYEDSQEARFHPPPAHEQELLQHPSNPHGQQPPPQGERESIADGATPIQPVKHHQQHSSQQHQHHRTMATPLDKKLENEQRKSQRKGSIEVHVHEPETKKAADAVTVKPTALKVSHEQHHSAHHKNRPEPEVSLEETGVSSVPIDGEAGKPSGAILSLAFGLVLTIIMVILVACRLRVVRKRLRRGGKSPYAHDADYLVNGMYL